MVEESKANHEIKVTQVPHRRIFHIRRAESDIGIPPLCFLYIFWPSVNSDHLKVQVAQELGEVAHAAAHV